MFAEQQTKICDNDTLLLGPERLVQTYEIIRLWDLRYKEYFIIFCPVLDRTTLCTIGFLSTESC